MLVVTLTIGDGIGPAQSATFTHWSTLVGALGSILQDDGVGTITITKSTPVDLDFVEPQPAQAQARSADAPEAEEKIPLSEKVSLSVAQVDTSSDSV